MIQNIVKNHISPQTHSNQTTLQNYSNKTIYNFLHGKHYDEEKQGENNTQGHIEKKKNWKFCQIALLLGELLYKFMLKKKK